ncbi:TrmH family RNA methyltransferase [Serinibacter arcticus]|uniref:tRNA (Guanosine(18)-2'-O)-methyltransferase n=1 Tax=Serinibacter arcticus TaxID=1655435 RepID=A0A4Z1E8C0_9MICO|nr:RNA methyltransferase [Serinibacter arcticus]TGO05827.1 tRNA (guanosine(18)-2'-O)-methyltransferase [Serinibacter arcticus]
MPFAAAVVNTRSDRVAGLRRLVTRAGRDRAGEHLVEGPQACREAVRFAAERVRDLYITEAAQSRWPEIVDDALAHGLYVHPTSPEVMVRISEDAQGVVLVLRDADVATDELAAVVAGARLVALCEEVRDPGNAGTIIRAADAAGADAVVLTAGSVDVRSPKVVRSSAGSLFHLPVVTGVGLADAVATLRAAGLTILAADGGGADDVETSPLLARPTAWIFGTEAQGLSDDARQLADAVVAVPLRGRAESLNVAMAATVCLYASSRVHALST